jgi:hypothetical protein
MKQQGACRRMDGMGWDEKPRHSFSLPGLLTVMTRDEDETEIHTF